MKKGFIISAIACLLSIVPIFGQRLSNYDKRHMNDKLLEMVISYENYSAFSESHMQYSFIDLFSNADAQVYCDYIASARFGQPISASDYAAYSTETIHVKFVEVRNLRKGDYQFRDGRYKVIVNFDKCLEYEDELFTYFTTTDETIGGDFHITMECEYNKEEDKFFILSISGNKNSNSTFPSGKFVVIERKNDRDEFLKVNGKPLSFNAFKEAYADSETAPVFADEDIITKTTIVGTTDRYSKVNYSYKETRFRLRAGVTAAPISAYKVNSPVSFTNEKSSLYEASIDFGYALPIGARAKLAFYAGLGVSYSHLDLAIQDINYDYELSDLSSKTYSRSYQLNNVTEGLSFVDLLLPVYASYEVSLGKSVALSLDAGIKLYLNTKTTVHPYTVDGSTSTVYGATAQSTNPLPAVIDQYMVPASYMRNTYDVAAFGKLGFEFKVKDRRYIFLKVGYMHGLTESYKSSLNEWFNNAEGIYPFVYSVKSDSDIAVRSFADCISYRRSALTFDLGFRMKF